MLKTNNDYRQYLIYNTTNIMQNNFQLPDLAEFEKKSYPYLFNGLNDNKKPYGYETSLPKQNYIHKEKIDSTKINILKENI